MGEEHDDEPGWKGVGPAGQKSPSMRWQKNWQGLEETHCTHKAIIILDIAGIILGVGCTWPLT